MTNRKLPKQYVDTSALREAPLGEIVWTVPWAMTVGKDRNCYLNTDYRFIEAPTGTAQLAVRRLIGNLFQVTLSPDYKYELEDVRDARLVRVFAVEEPLPVYTGMDLAADADSSTGATA